TRLLLAFLGLLPVVALELGLVRGVRPAPVTVVRLVIQYDDALLAAQLAAHSVHHLVRRLSEGACHVAAEELLREARGIPTLAWQEAVVVRDDDLGALELLK